MRETAASILNSSPAFSTANNVSSFEQQYIQLRRKEGRIYSDDEVNRLPDVPASHRYYHEWQLRKESLERVKKYFEKKSKSLQLLEVGCGNGWLSNQFSKIAGCHVTGTDINETELLQAKRVFATVPNLRFIKGGLIAAEIEQEKFDAIIFASSIQNYASLKDVVKASFEKLNPQGEIIISDSPFYKDSELAAAKERTTRYFTELGFPAMAENYFHHSREELETFRPQLLYKPGFISKYFGGNKNPFPIVIIMKQ